MIIMHHVRHVLELKKSLVSIDMLAEAGYMTTLSEYNIKIDHGRKYNNLYLLIVFCSEGSLHVVENAEYNVMAWQDWTSYQQSTTYQNSIKLIQTFANIASIGNRPEVRTQSITRR